MVSETQTKLLLGDELSGGKQMVLFFSHTSPTIQSIQKSIPALGSWDKDEDEVRALQNIAVRDGPQAPNDIDSERLRLHTLRYTCVFKMRC